MSKIIPILYIPDQSGQLFPSLKVDGTPTGKVYTFPWEANFRFFNRFGREQRGAHVLRFQTIEEYHKGQADILGTQLHWKVLFDVEAKASNADGDESELQKAYDLLEAEVEELREANHRLTERVHLIGGEMQGKEAYITELEEALSKPPAVPVPATKPDEGNGSE